MDVVDADSDSVDWGELMDSDVDSGAADIDTDSDVSMGLAWYACLLKFSCVIFKI